MRVVSVNVGGAGRIGERGGEPIYSGIAKRPLLQGSVHLGRLGLAGDTQVETSVHGGIDKAVYAYPLGHAGFWRELGIAQRPATFGENLTLEGLDEDNVAIGDRFRVGEAFIEVSEPRGPCWKLDMHLKAVAAHHMTLSGFCGFYCRVIEEGPLPLPQPSLVRVFASGAPTVRQTFLARHGRSPRDVLEAAHAAPALAEGWRNALAKRLQSLRKPGIESADSRV